MNNQYPTPRSLKDDPPPSKTMILAYYKGDPICGSDWCKIESDYAIANGFHTHWLPMPPDPSPQKQPWEEAYMKIFADYPPTYSDSFKAGWNAALDQVCAFRGFNLSSEQYTLWADFLNKVKAS